MTDIKSYAEERQDAETCAMKRSQSISWLGRKRERDGEGSGLEPEIVAFWWRFELARLLSPGLSYVVRELGLLRAGDIAQKDRTAGQGRGQVHREDQ